MKIMALSVSCLQKSKVFEEHQSSVLKKILKWLILIFFLNQFVTPQVIYFYS